MGTIPPIVSQMIVCNDVTSEGGGRSLNIRGLVHRIAPAAGQEYPLMHPQLCVYVLLSGGVGTGRVQLIVREADTDVAIFGSGLHRVTFPTDRHEVGTLVFRMGDCIFPRPGLYWMEFHTDGHEIRRETVILR